MSIDKRGRLDEQPFSHRATKDGRVMLYWRGRHIKTISGNEAARFLRDLEGLAPHELQLLLAKETGNFKHGNERERKSRS
jgi:hypothetical protein